MAWLTDTAALSLLAVIYNDLQTIKQRDADVQQRLEDLKAVLEEVKGNTSAVVAAIENLASQLDAAKDDPEEVAAIVEEMRGINEQLEGARARGKKSK
jgi:archaellum component FlaC